MEALARDRRRYWYRTAAALVLVAHQRMVGDFGDGDRGDCLARASTPSEVGQWPAKRFRLSHARDGCHYNDWLVGHYFSDETRASREAGGVLSQGSSGRAWLETNRN